MFFGFLMIFPCVDILKQLFTRCTIIFLLIFRFHFHLNIFLFINIFNIFNNLLMFFFFFFVDKIKDKKTNECNITFSSCSSTIFSFWFVWFSCCCGFCFVFSLFFFCFSCWEYSSCSFNTFWNSSSSIDCHFHFFFFYKNKKRRKCWTRDV